MDFFRELSATPVMSDPTASHAGLAHVAGDALNTSADHADTERLDRDRRGNAGV
jgi:hypothetical protein